MALWMASLPADYACAKGAEPLVRTARLTGKPKRRYVETGQMIINAMTPGALETGALGYETIRHVRVMHAAVRHLLLHGEDLRSPAGDPIGAWDDALGVPLNQEDLLGCLFSFSVVGIDALRRSGVRVTDAEAEAYIHTWNLVGHQLGIRSDLLPLDWADSVAIWEHIKARAYAQSDAGRELTAAAIECMQDLIRIGPLGGLAGGRHPPLSRRPDGRPAGGSQGRLDALVLHLRPSQRHPLRPDLGPTPRRPQSVRGTWPEDASAGSSSPSATGTDQASKLPTNSGPRGEWGALLDPPVTPRDLRARVTEHVRGSLNRSCLRTAPALTCDRTRGVPCDVVLQEVLRDH